MLKRRRELLLCFYAESYVCSLLLEQDFYPKPEVFYFAQVNTTLPSLEEVTWKTWDSRKQTTVKCTRCPIA